ncbi:hypothetical protein [Bradyrhizobium algeriense]|uniref:hypothetical protein n=1 Tax=Bradyrhizobium algeriense TaxID=634784 RepID=UPI000D3AF811|nr:hypothetical protein [Bradyrhizobium algeriense]
MSGLDRFWQLLHEYSKLSLWAAGGSIVIPFVASFLSIIPPWPTGLNIITSVIQLASLAISYQSASNKAGKVAFNMKILGAVGFALVLVYMFLFTTFTIFVPQAQRSIVIGYECLPDALKVFNGRSCLSLNVDDLATVAFDEFLIWTKTSVAVIRAVLVGVWLSLFVVIASLLGQFLAYQMKLKVGPR